MRIAHLTWSLGIGGIQTMLAEIANIQIQHGHEVGIFEVDSIVSETVTNKLDPRIKIFKMGRTRGKKAVVPFIKLNWDLWRFKPDIIHSHAGNVIRVVASRRPCLATIHGLNANPKDYRKYKSIYSISKIIQQEWIEKWGITPILIENGIDCGLIKSKSNYILSDEIHIIQVGRLKIDVKGQDILAKAFSNLLNILHDDFSFHNRKVILHFFGDGPDQGLLINMVDKLGIKDNVIIEGPKDRNWLFEHLCDYDLFVQPSRREGFGLTVAEACAAKVPVLVSNIEGPLEIIDGGRLGATFKSEDVDDLTEKLLSFVRGGYNYDLLEEAGQYVLSNYDIKRTASMYMNEYDKILMEYK